MLKFLRDVELTVDGGALVIRDLKVRFRCSASLSSENNDADFSIWNLTSSHRSKFTKEFKEIEFEAGYSPPLGGSNKSTLFKGFIRDVKHERDGMNIITNVKCGDGDKGTREGYAAKTFPAGATHREIIEEIVSGMEGVEVGELLGIDDNPPFRRPVTIMGSVVRELNKLSRTGQYSWMINRGQLETIPKDKNIEETTIISQDTGMVGIPTVTDKGVSVKTLLEPRILPGRLIDVRSETLEMNGEGGKFRVNNVLWTGDNRDGSFLTEIEGTRI